MNHLPITSRALATAVLVLGTASLQGCATTQNRDPLEPLNRKIFGFNEAVDKAVLKPLATGYDTITPQPVQTGLSNFISNIKDIWSAINLVLQGRPGEAAQEVLRVSVNTTLGFAGFIDVASSMQLDSHGEDFGQTLGVWGVSSGAYLVLPILGPSTARDVMGLPGDLYFQPSTLFGEPRDANAARVLTAVHLRAQALGATNLLGDVALDKYAFIRDAYLQRRQNLIYNGEPPDTDTADEEDDRQGLSPVQGPWHAAAWRKPLDLPQALDATLPDTGLVAHVLASPVLPMPAPGQAAALRAPSHAPAVSENHGLEAPAMTPDELAGLRAGDELR